MGALDFSSLGDAISQLRAGLATLASDPANTLLRDGVIQRFEFTYGLTHKMLLRFLESTSADLEEVRAMSFPSMVRAAVERGLLKSGWDRWIVFREARNITSHTYHRAKAEKVMESVPSFLAEAEFLYEQLEKQNSPTRDQS